MDNGPAIEEHGLIGDLQTGALVTTDATVDWLCCPRFDSPSVFAGLLDRERGGYFRVAPDSAGSTVRQLYLPGTAILITRFMTPDGVGEVADFMPVVEGPATDRHRLVRLVRVVRGRMSFVVECQPRFDYGRAEHRTTVGDNGVSFVSDSLTLNLSFVGEPVGSGDLVVAPDGSGVRAVITGTAGRIGGMVLESAPAGPPRPLSEDDIRVLAETTRDYWRTWLSRSQYRGRWRETVERAAMTIKLMTYAPTGAPVAALTTGLPEQLGGERNWDYRYTWIRDGSFSVRALLGLGFTEEAEAFVRWLGDRIKDAGGKVSPLRIMYRVDGTTDIDEATLEHLAGYRDSRPVRIGNGAADQLQLDIFGEALDCIHLAEANGLILGHEGWRHLCDIVDWLSDNWDQPDDGIWETRGGRHDFVYGRVMSWVAVDRAIRLAVRRGRPADVPRWMAVRDSIYRQVMDRGWHAGREAFVQHYDTDVLDAALLSMPLVGFVSPTDRLWRSTLRAMDTELVTDSLVHRYNPAASPDGLRGQEGTFSMCSFWYVDALARSGRLNDARLAFEKMLTYGNHLGLYAEEISSTGTQQGNFPQALTHLALISAAFNLDRALDSPTASAGGWP